MGLTLPPDGEIWYAGDTIGIDFDLVEGDAETPLDITGAELVFTAKQKSTDADNAFTTIQKNTSNGIEVLDAVNGQITVTLDPADTTNLRSDTTLIFDLQVTFSDTTVATLITGTLTITGDVTQI
jgi:hypothetical protein